MIKVAVSGCNGKMGGQIRKFVEADPGLRLAGAFDVKDDPRPHIEACDVLIEFTVPEATIRNLGIAMELGKAVVIGTTGLDEKMMDAVRAASKSIAVVCSPNMAIGVNLLFRLVKEAAACLDGSYSVSISETHHVHKKDSPSGTAKRLRDIVAAARGLKGDEVKVESRRTGEVVGDHAVLLDGPEERLELIHKAKSRGVFARGAIAAAKFAAARKAGLYGMGDVLGI